jgi:gliding motility-associated-like protein
LITAFTPNGDGLNDEFFIYADALSELRVRIFSRSGRLEYEITHPGQRWDGKNQQGSELPSGSYFYDIFARSNSGQTINQKGTINLFR